MRHTTLLLLLAVLLPACGQVDLRFGGLDTGQLEVQIAEELESDLEGVEIDTVDCPGDVQPRAGDVFVCRVHAVDGSVGTVEVTQVDDAGGVQWRLTDVRPPE